MEMRVLSFHQANVANAQRSLGDSVYLRLQRAIPKT